MRIAPGRAWVLCWLPVGLWLVSVGLAVGLCQAQEPAAGEPSAKPKADSADAGPAGAKAVEPKPLNAKNTPAAAADAHHFDIRYLEGPDGRPVYIPDKVRLDEFLNWLEQKNAGAQQGPPQFSVASASFEGAADDEKALLKARIGVLLSAEDVWVRIPLILTEATLRSPPVHTGEGLAVPAPYHPEEGYAWWLKGKGKHELVLDLSVPLRKQALQRRLQLSAPAAVAGELRLRVGSPRVAARVPDRSTLSTKTAGRETEIEVIGLGNRIDLTWQPLAETTGVETALEVTTSIVATLVDGESATLEATQRIQSLGQQGTFESVRVSLPPGSELLRLDGPEHRDHKSDPTNPNQVLVQLKKPTSGPVDLKWTVRTKLPPVGEPFALEGFEVERARLQTGYLAVVVVGDFRIVRQSDQDKFLERLDLADLPAALRQAPAGAAYRFLNRLLLRMKLQRVDPYVTVDPAILLHLSSDAAEVEGTCRVQVLRGSLGSFRMRWPHWKDQGWTMTEAELPGHIELRVAEDAGDPNVLRFEFAEPVKGAIDLRFHARRALANVGEAVSLTLPAPEGYGRFPTLLGVLPADNVEADLRPTEPTVLRSLNETDSRIAVPRDWQMLRRADYRIESAQSEFSLALSVHPRRIQGTTLVEASLKSSAVRVRQKFVFDVAYERISQLRFGAPERVPAEQVRFFSQSGVELPAVAAPQSGRAPAELRVNLDSPGIGRFEVEARYALGGLLPAGDSSATELSVPLMQSHDAKLSSTRFSCRDAAGRELVVEGEGWIRQLAPEGSPVWMMPQVPGAVSIKVSRSGSATQRGPVLRTLIKSTVSGDGAIISHGHYNLAEGITELVVAFPPGVIPTAFHWNRDEISVAPPVKSSDGGTQYDIVIPEASNVSERLLTIGFTGRSGGPSRVSTAYAIDAPTFPDETGGGQVLWQVVLPFDQHLFTEPAGFAPGYRWRSGKPFWSREPDLSAPSLDQWIGASAGPSGAPMPDGGNGYVFGAYDQAPRLVFRAMSRSGIVFIGAVTAWLLGMVLVKWPATRHVLTFLTVGFAVSLLGVWFTVPVQVLLQPAVLGVLLAVLAAMIDSFLKRRARPVTVTLTSPSGLTTPASSHARGPAAGVGSNDYTSLRTPEDALPAGELSETGNRA